MSDKVRWAGPRTGAPRLEPIERYVLAKVDVYGSTHVGRIIDGVCMSICNYAQNDILLPVADGKVECPHCKCLMKRDHIEINMSVQFVEGKV